jgi:hypothetical protein
MKEWVGQAHWLIGWDFNLIDSLEEKKGGIRALSGVSTTFNKVIEDLHLVDVHTPNGFHTWKSKCSRMRHIASLLDRFLVSESVLTGKGELGAFVMLGVGSDH